MASTMSEYRKKKERIHAYLGTSCVKCGSTEKLQVDHIDHLKKEFDVMKNWAWSWARLEPELKKCQLLCKACHIEKTIAEGSLGKGWTNEPRQEHGTVNSYNKYKCRCVECKAAKSVYERDLRIRQLYPGLAQSD